MVLYLKSMNTRSIFLLVKYVETGFDVDVPVKGNFCLAVGTLHTHSET